ncbi:RLA2 protein, partial [Crypturellus undulatus]|nr:RLA2 protein [Crypturellus undulatus]
MRYVAAYLLAVLGGNESPTSKDLKKILDSVGIETDDERVNKVVISELNGKNIEDVIAQGKCGLCAVAA